MKKKKSKIVRSKEICKKENERDTGNKKQRKSAKKNKNAKRRENQNEQGRKKKEIKNVTMCRKI